MRNEWGAIRADDEEIKPFSAFFKLLQFVFSTDKKELSHCNQQGEIFIQIFFLVTSEHDL